MIARTLGRVGEPIRFEGSAYDFGHAIAAMEFSLDDGAHWTRYNTPETNDYQNLNWAFTWTPERAGFYVLHVRSVADDGRVSPESAFCEIAVSE